MAAIASDFAHPRLRGSFLLRTLNYPVQLVQLGQLVQQLPETPVLAPQLRKPLRCLISQDHPTSSRPSSYESRRMHRCQDPPLSPLCDLCRRRIFVKPAIAEKAPVAPPESYLTPPPLQSPIPVATPIAPKEESFPCECEGKIKVVCLPQDAFDHKCGRGAGACAKKEECRMYFSINSKACNEMQKTTPMQPVPMTNLAESLGVTESANLYQTERIFVAEPSAQDLATAMMSSLNIGTDALPSLEDLIDQCLFEHELDHLCRKTVNPTRCNREVPAMNINAKCFLDHLDKYCDIITPQNRWLCLNICNQYVHFGALSQMAGCFCQKLAEDKQQPGSFYEPESRNNCCECYAQCGSFSIPKPCRRFDNTVVWTRQNACEQTLKAGNVHTCAWYGQWPNLPRNNPSVLCPDPLSEEPN